MTRVDLSISGLKIDTARQSSQIEKKTTSTPLLDNAEIDYEQDQEQMKS